MKQSSKKTAGPQAYKCPKPSVKNIGGAAKSFKPRFTGTQTRSGTSRQGSY